MTENQKSAGNGGFQGGEDAPLVWTGPQVGAVPVRPPVREVLPGVFASSALETVYLIRCNRRSVLVDTGFVHNFAAHMENFEAAGQDLSTVDAILASHFHVDHTGALANARARFGCPTVAHRDNVSAFETGDRVASAAYVPYAGWDFPFPPCPIDHAAEDGDILDIDGVEFRVVHLPGHTPGCTGYLFGDGCLVIGDVVFPGGMLGWNDAHWGSNLLDTIDTMRRLASLSPKVCLPSHGLPWPWDASTSEGAIRRAQTMLADGTAAGMLCTFRAPRADPGRTQRRIRLGREE